MHSTDAAYCCTHRRFRGRRVCLLGTRMSPATTDAPIEEQFRGRLFCGPRGNLVLNDVHILIGKEQFYGSLIRVE